MFDVDGINMQMSQDAQGMVHLDGTIAQRLSAAADTLNKTFGVSLFKAGIRLGVVHVVASAK